MEWHSKEERRRQSGNFEIQVKKLTLFKIYPLVSSLLLYKQQRYQDEAIIRDLNLKIDKMAEKITEKNYELSREISETKAMQLQMEKAAEDFKYKLFKLWFKIRNTEIYIMRGRNW